MVALALAHRRGLILLSVLAILGCDEPCDERQLPEKNGGRATVTQGIWGDVWFWQGDFMPLCGTGTVSPVIREIRIHDAARYQDTEPTFGTFFRRVNTPLVATVHSSNRGFFQADLAPGIYSVFVVEDTLLYANGSDGVYIHPVEVTAGMRHEAHIDITYNAHYKPSRSPVAPSPALGSWR